MWVVSHLKDGEKKFARDMERSIGLGYVYSGGVLGRVREF